MRSRSLVLPLVFAALTTLSTAQTFETLTGTIVADASSCDPSASHRLDCTDVALRSSSVDLSASEGQVVRITGLVSAAGAGCVTMEVDTLESAPRRLVLTAPEGYRPGRAVLATVQAAFGAQVFFGFAGSPGFGPIPNFGVLLIDPVTAWIDPVSVPSFGVALTSYTIPLNPAVVGCEIFVQSIAVNMPSATDVEVEMLNAACFVVVP